MNEPDRTVVNRLVSELGRAVTAVHAAVQEAPDEPSLAAAHGRLAEATALVVELARGPSVDPGTIARAWQAIAAAQDAVEQARAAVARAREHNEVSALLRRETAGQAQRARTHAARIRWSWNTHRRSGDD